MIEFSDEELGFLAAVFSLATAVHNCDYPAFKEMSEQLETLDARHPDMGEQLRQKVAAAAEAAGFKVVETGG